MLQDDYIDDFRARSIPCAHFPALDEDTYYRDFAFRTEWYDKLGGPETGCVRFAGGRVLTGCVDAGERWSFGCALFEPMFTEAERLGETPVGPLHGYLLTRVHDGTGAFHRYVKAILPLA